MASALGALVESMLLGKPGIAPGDIKAAKTAAFSRVLFPPPLASDTDVAGPEANTAEIAERKLRLCQAGCGGMAGRIGSLVSRLRADSERSAAVEGMLALLLDLSELPTRHLRGATDDADGETVSNLSAVSWVSSSAETLPGLFGSSKDLLGWHTASPGDSVASFFSPRLQAPIPVVYHSTPRDAAPLQGRQESPPADPISWSCGWETADAGAGDPIARALFTALPRSAATPAPRNPAAPVSRATSAAAPQPLARDIPATSSLRQPAVTPTWCPLDDAKMRGRIRTPAARASALLQFRRLPVNVHAIQMKCSRVEEPGNPSNRLIDARLTVDDAWLVSLAALGLADSPALCDISGSGGEVALPLARRAVHALATAAGREFIDLELCWRHLSSPMLMSGSDARDTNTLACCINDAVAGALWALLARYRWAIVSRFCDDRAGKSSALDPMSTRAPSEDIFMVSGSDFVRSWHHALQAVRRALYNGSAQCDATGALRPLRGAALLQSLFLATATAIDGAPAMAKGDAPLQNVPPPAVALLSILQHGLQPVEGYLNDRASRREAGGPNGIPLPRLPVLPATLEDSWAALCSDLKPRFLRREPGSSTSGARPLVTVVAALADLAASVREMSPRLIDILDGRGSRHVYQHQRHHLVLPSTHVALEVTGAAQTESSIAVRGAVAAWAVNALVKRPLAHLLRRLRQSPPAGATSETVTQSDDVASTLTTPSVLSSSRPDALSDGLVEQPSGALADLAQATAQLEKTLSSRDGDADDASIATADDNIVTAGDALAALVACLRRLAAASPVDAELAVCAVSASCALFPNTIPLALARALLHATGTHVPMVALRRRSGSTWSPPSTFSGALSSRLALPATTRRASSASLTSARSSACATEQEGNRNAVPPSATRHALTAARPPLPAAGRPGIHRAATVGGGHLRRGSSGGCSGSAAGSIVSWRTGGGWGGSGRSVVEGVVAASSAIARGLGSRLSAGVDTSSSALWDSASVAGSTRSLSARSLSVRSVAQGPSLRTAPQGPRSPASGTSAAPRGVSRTPLALSLALELPRWEGTAPPAPAARAPPLSSSASPSAASDAGRAGGGEGSVRGGSASVRSASVASIALGRTFTVRVVSRGAGAGGAASVRAGSQRGGGGGGSVSGRTAAVASSAGGGGGGGLVLRPLAAALVSSASAMSLGARAALSARARARVPKGGHFSFDDDAATVGVGGLPVQSQRGGQRQRRLSSSSAPPTTPEQPSAASAAAAGGVSSAASPTSAAADGRDVSATPIAYRLALAQVTTGSSESLAELQLSAAKRRELAAAEVRDVRGQADRAAATALARANASRRAELARLEADAAAAAAARSAASAAARAEDAAFMERLRSAGASVLPGLGPSLQEQAGGSSEAPESSALLSEARDAVLREFGRRLQSLEARQQQQQQQQQQSRQSRQDAVAVPEGGAAARAAADCVAVSPPGSPNEARPSGVGGGSSDEGGEDEPLRVALDAMAALGPAGLRHAAATAVSLGWVGWAPRSGGCGKPAEAAAIREAPTTTLDEGAPPGRSAAQQPQQQQQQQQQAGDITTGEAAASAGPASAVVSAKAAPTAPLPPPGLSRVLSPQTLARITRARAPAPPLDGRSQLGLYGVPLAVPGEEPGDVPPVAAAAAAEAAAPPEPPRPKSRVPPRRTSAAVDAASLPSGGGASHGGGGSSSSMAALLDHGPEGLPREGHALAAAPMHAAASSAAAPSAAASSVEAGASGEPTAAARLGFGVRAATSGLATGVAADIDGSCASWDSVPAFAYVSDAVPPTLLPVRGSRVEMRQWDPVEPLRLLWMQRRAAPVTPLREPSYSEKDERSDALEVWDAAVALAGGGGGAAATGGSAPPSLPLPTAPLHHVLRVALLQPLHARAALWHAAAAASLLLEHGLLGHFEAIRAWLLLGEGLPASLAAEALFRALAPLPGTAEYAAAARVRAAAGTSSSSSSSHVGLSLAGHLLPVTVADAVAAANSALDWAAADSGLAARCAELGEDARRRVQLRLAEGRIVTALAATAAPQQRRGAASYREDEGGDAKGVRRDPGLPRRAEQLRDITAAAAASCGASAAELHWHRVRYVAAPSTSAAETDPSRRLLPSPLWHPRTTDVLLVTYSLGADADAAHCRVAQASPLGTAAAASSSHLSAVAAVITPTALRRCAAVHAFLLRLRRARFELGRARAAVGRAGPPPRGRQQQRKRKQRLPPAKGAAAVAAVEQDARLHPSLLLPPSAPLFLYEAWHFATALDAYVAGQAAHACHARLLGEAATAESPAALHAAFEAHSRRLLERCLLPPVEGGADTDAAAAAAPPIQRGRAAALAAAAAAVDAALAVSLRFCYAVHAHAASAASGGGGQGSPELLTAAAVAAFTAELRRHVDVLARGVARALAAGAAGADDGHLRDLAARLAGCTGLGATGRAG